MKKTPPVEKSVGKTTKSKAAPPAPDSNTPTTGGLEPTGIKIGEGTSHQSRRTGFFQSRHGTKK